MNMDIYKGLSLASKPKKVKFFSFWEEFCLIWNASIDTENVSVNVKYPAKRT